MRTNTQTPKKTKHLGCSACVHTVRTNAERHLRGAKCRFQIKLIDVRHDDSGSHKAKFFAVVIQTCSTLLNILAKKENAIESKFEAF